MHEQWSYQLRKVLRANFDMDDRLRVFLFLTKLNTVVNDLQAGGTRLQLDIMHVEELLDALTQIGIEDKDR